MSDMVGKVSVQGKIAELESRIAALEARSLGAGGRFKVRTVQHLGHVGLGDDSIFGKDWNEMWASFARVMKRAFGSEA